MTYIITDACVDVHDASCLEVCPVDCIYDIGRMFVIAPSECIDCAACVWECPVQAIVDEPDLPPDLEAFRDIAAAVGDGASEAASRLDAYESGRR